MIRKLVTSYERPQVGQGRKSWYTVQYEGEDIKFQSKDFKKVLDERKLNSKNTCMIKYVKDQS